MSDDARAAALMWPDMAKQTPAPAPRRAPTPTTAVQQDAAPEAHDAPVSDATAAAIVYGDAPQDKPKPRERIVARASNALRDEERLYPSMAKAEAEAAEAESQGDGANGDEAAAPVEMLEVAPGVTIAAPQGFEEINSEALDAFGPIVERLRMPKADAQALVDLHARGVKEAADGVLAWQEDEFGQMKREWAEQARNDPELNRGGFQHNIANAKIVLRNFAPSEFRELASDFGLNSNPHFIRFLARLHGAIYAKSRRVY